MLFKKRGMPKEGDILFCTVTKVQYHSVFARLDDFEHKSGMIHISEVSPGRIRNINDYVKEGKVVICKVLRINKDRGHIDLSLRRVTESQRREKVEERKHQIIAENILQSYAQLNKLDVKKVYLDVDKLISQHYEFMYDAFEAFVEEEISSLTELGLDKTLATSLETLIRERIKPKEVSIESTLHLESYDENGVEIINNVMKKVNAIDKESLKIHFLGSGGFKTIITTPDYKEAEEIFAKMESAVQDNIKGTQTTYKLARI